MENDETVLEKRKLATRLISQYIKEISSRDYAKEYMGEWVEPIAYQPIYILASNYQIAKSIFDHYFLHTELARRIDLRYIDDIHRVYGLRNQYIVISGERYPNDNFYERLYFLQDHARYREIELIHEQDLEKEQIREKVSRQRPQETKGK